VHRLFISGIEKLNNGNRIHAKNGTPADLSSIGVEALGRLAVDVIGGARPPSAPGFMRW